MQIEICVQSYFYQLRFCWMLSSIAQQIDHDLDIIITCSYLKNHKDGNPSNLQIIDFFTQKNIKIIGYEYSSDRMLNRAYFRNDRAKNTKSDWLLFADCDMIYHPLFFSHLEKQLKDKQYNEATKVFGADRISLSIEACEKLLVNYQSIEPFFIENPCKILENLPLERRTRGRNRAAGYFQLVKGDVIRSIGKYSTRYNGFLADQSVRKLLGGVIGLDLLPQYHLNHYRDSRFRTGFSYGGQVQK